MAGLLAGTSWSLNIQAAEQYPPRTAWTSLDGRTFQGEMLGGDGKVIATSEQLVFRNGRFISEACREYGFTEAPYWIRVENGKVHFLAETTSPNNGTMRWKGIITDGKVDARFVWTKERWYWTIEREFRVRAAEKK